MNLIFPQVCLQCLRTKEKLIFYSQGTGFFVDKNTLITNSHCVDGSDRLEFKITGDEEIYKGAKIMKALEEYKNRIVTYRIIVEHSKLSNNTIEDNVKQLSLDHLSEFKKYILEQLGTSDIVTTELEELCK